MAIDKGKITGRRRVFKDYPGEAILVTFIKLSGTVKDVTAEITRHLERSRDVWSN